MSDFLVLSCPTCGYKLHITDGIDRFVCAACGNEHVVNRSGGIFTLKPVVEEISKVQAGGDKTTAELAIARIKDELKQLGEPIKYSEAALEILSNPSRKATFMRAYKYIKGMGLSTPEKPTIRDTKIEDLKIFSTLTFNDLVKMNDYFANRYISGDESIVSYILRKIINSTIYEGKLRELAKYQEILSKNW